MFQAAIAVLLLSVASAVPLASAHAQKLEKLIIGYPAPVASLGIIDMMRKGVLFKTTGLTSISSTMKPPALTGGVSYSSSFA